MIILWVAAKWKSTKFFGVTYRTLQEPIASKFAYKYSDNTSVAVPYGKHNFLALDKFRKGIKRIRRTQILTEKPSDPAQLRTGFRLSFYPNDRLVHVYPRLLSSLINKTVNLQSRRKNENLQYSCITCDG